MPPPRILPVSALACALAMGCSSPPLSVESAGSGSSVAAAGAVALTPNDGGMTPVGPSTTGEGGAGSGSATGSPCGALRGGDAREVCFAGTTFTMGSNANNLGASFADHTPAHPVTLSAFVLDAYEVSVGRYSACVQAGACVPPSAACPVASASTQTNGAVLCVPWAQADAFCKWDGGRLPTEAEWELAARGTSARSYPWGDAFDCTRAIVGGYPGGPCGTIAGPGPVTSMQLGASPEQVYNLSGNVAEWVADWVGSYKAGAQSNPTGPTTGTEKVVRGGAFSSLLVAALGYARMPIDPNAAGPWGFRCARDAAP